MANRRSTAGFGKQIRTLFDAGALGASTDGVLLDEFARGGEAADPAFAMLVERHGPMVLRVCRNLLADAHLAEDAFQATFLLLARRAGSIYQPESLAGWLHRVARRVALRARIQNSRREDHEVRAATEIAVAANNPAERDELQSIVHEEIDRLRSTQRLPILLCAIEGLSHEEAAHRLRWPVGTVKSRLVRGRRRLEARLTRRGLAPALAIAAASTAGASADVPLTLAVATTRIAASGAVGASAAGASITISATIRTLLNKELSAVYLARLTLVAGMLLAAGTMVVAFSAALADPPRWLSPGTDPQTAKAQAPVSRLPVTSPAKVEHAKSLSPSTVLAVTGRVVGTDGHPVAGAKVLIREWAIYRTRGMPQRYADGLLRGQEIPDILAESATDAKGEFRFSDVIAPGFNYTGAESVGKTVFPWDVVAYAPGHGIAWSHLTPRYQRSAIALTLPAEGTLRGQVFEPGGKPIVGAQVKVAGIDPLGHVDPRGTANDGRLNLSWSSVPLVATTGPDGRVTLQGLPRGIVATLVITDRHYERKVIYAATTDQPQHEIMQTTNVQGQTVTEKKPIYSGEFRVSLNSTDHRLVGRVVFSATGKPAAGAQVSVRQRRVAEADANGKFVIDNLPPGEVELHLIAWNTDAAPLDLRLMIADEPKTIEREFALPAGLMVTGQVVDQDTSAGIGDAELIYRPRPEPGRVPSYFGFRTKTGPDGRFRMVVPAGPGGVEILKLPPSYPDPLSEARTLRSDPRFKLDFNGKPGDNAQELNFRLERGKTITLTVLGPAGKPVAGAEVFRRGRTSPAWTANQTDAAGRCELRGVTFLNGAMFDITHPTQPLGARVVLRPDDLDAARRPGGIEVKLEPTGSITGRVLDESGKPLIDPVVRLQTVVRYPDRSVTRNGDVRADGSFTFDRLLAGVSYSVYISAEGHAGLSGKHVRAKPGETSRLEEFRLPVADQELQGIVVDPRGNPLAGVVVAFQCNADRQLVAPRPRAWSQQTDDHGRFHLTALPKGPSTLMAYRKPEGTDRSTRNRVQLETEVGGPRNEVRIVLPDANARLRGIE